MGPRGGGEGVNQEWDARQMTTPFPPGLEV